jgi:hypothetical protein
MSAVVSRMEAPAVVQDIRRGPAPPNATLDLLVGICGLWLAAGFLWDSWAHLHVSIESFFTPYHAIFYSAMVAGMLILAVFARRNLALGFTGLNALPAAYQSALWGIPLFFAGGVGDLIWHTFFGIEDRVEAVTSPTHLVIGCGVLLVLSAPIRSALQQRATLTTLRSQLPLLFALATWLEFIHLGTAYALDPAAARMYAPPDATLYGPDYFTNTTWVSFKTGSGVAIIILQALILMGPTLWMVARFRLAPGALAIFFVAGNCMIAATLSGDTPLLFTYICMSIAAGIVGDVVIARLHPTATRAVAFGLFGVLTAGAYYATYVLVTALTGGIWWSWTLTLGGIVWSMLCGLSLSFVAGQRNDSVMTSYLEGDGAFTTPSRSL